MLARLLVVGEFDNAVHLIVLQVAGMGKDNQLAEQTKGEQLQPQHYEQ